MNFNHETHKTMLLSLIENNVDFILIGGYAVVYHGYIRSTGDMDVWLRPTNENKERLVTVFKQLDFDAEGIQHIQGLNFNEVVVFHVGIVPEKIDFLTKVQGLNFDDAYSQKQLFPLKNKFVPVLHLNDLIVNKLITDRPQDKADVDMLQKINQK